MQATKARPKHGSGNVVSTLPKILAAMSSGLPSPSRDITERWRILIWLAIRTGRW